MLYGIMVSIARGGPGVFFQKEVGMLVALYQPMNRDSRPNGDLLGNSSDY